VDKDPLSHVDGTGKLRMVDVSAKESTVRIARARCEVVTSPGSSDRGGDIDNAQVQSARLTGIQAAKWTAHIIPLCHPLVLDNVQVDITATETGWELTSAVTTIGRTGVEMEALTACAYGAVSLIGALGASGRKARVTDLMVTSKIGGKRDWSLPAV
jgi:cyclic pyranopterin phosphate synthase